MKVLLSRRTITPSGIGPKCVWIDGEVIARVDDYVDPSNEEHKSYFSVANEGIFDYGDLILAPGLVDTHVHINEPGRTEWEGFETATAAAARGGVTTLMDMPLNSIPPTTTPMGVAAKIQAADGTCSVDVALCGGLVPENAERLDEVVREGVFAFKAFMAPSGVDEFGHVDRTHLPIAMRTLADRGLPLLLHAELASNIDEAEKATRGDPKAYRTYLQSRPGSAEEAAIALVFELAKDSGARAHIVHLSAAPALRWIERARLENVPLSVETCPHYLNFAAETIPDGATAFKCAPPIREEANRLGLWDGLRQGLLTQVVTDHSPSSADLKCVDSGDFMKAWGGISSLEIGLSAVWTAARAQGHTPLEVSRWMSEAPAKLVGLYGKKGAIAKGFDADICVWEDTTERTIDVQTLQHRHKICPYDKKALFGVVHATYLRGTPIYLKAEAIQSPRRGRILLRPQS